MTFRDLLTMNSMLLKIFAGKAIINSWLKQKKNPFNDDGDIIIPNFKSLVDKLYFRNYMNQRLLRFVPIAITQIKVCLIMKKEQFKMQQIFFY